MRCPIHKEVWLYENMLETRGYCPKCKKDYQLTKEQEQDKE
jgi:uncharacterized protein (DUF983 family)